MEVHIDSFMHSGQLKYLLKLIDEQTAEVRRKHEMKKAEIDIIYFLSRCDGNNTSTDIHHQLAMNRGQISQTVESLCRRGMLTAIPDQMDRRYIHYRLTDAAQEIAQEVAQVWQSISGVVFEGITPQEMDTFYAVSQKIAKNLEQAK